jgi:uncharacterized protein (DUF488 family)
MPLYTIGYEKRSIDEYVRILVENHIDVVMDVRETAWSHKPGFSKAAFEEALGSAGIRYVHVPELGNPKWLRATAADHAETLALFRAYVEGHPELHEGMDGALQDEGVEHRRIALTCFERHPRDCHRGILAELWSERRRRPVEHL